jgi:uncharacterized protein YcfJ
MKKEVVTTLAFAALLGGLAAPASAQVYGDVAKVLSSKPVYEKGPAPDCRDGKGIEPMGRPTAPDFGGAYRQISFRPAAAEAAPAAPATQPDPCRTRERVVGYDVHYQYNGREFRARMPYDPGKEMPVNVEVRPPMAPGALGPRSPQFRGTY